MLYFCCDERRRNEIERRNDLNGIEYLEVLDRPDQPADERQRILFVHFIRDPTGLGLVQENVVLEGGERIRDLQVVNTQVAVDPRSGSSDPVLVVEVDTPGDYATYTLRLVPTAGNAISALDPVLRAVDFSFKVNCETEFDPLQPRECADEPHSEPSLDYLARDFPSLRQMILDRLAVLLPDWPERNSADMGIALVDLLAYVGDQLSYRQDAVATEAYLGTCRLRTSARRHARLVDYYMHDGCNARVWVQVKVAAGTGAFTLPENVTFYSAVAGLPTQITPQSADEQQIKASGATVFRLIPTAVAPEQPLVLRPEHNVLKFYTWGARECCLPKGAVRATLRDNLPHLTPGMVLVFIEVISPRTGDPDDADLRHRHAVRLTEVSFGSDPVGGRFDLPPTENALSVTEIRWADEDALPFPVCISAETTANGGVFVDNVSVALGNIVLADHGSDFESEDLGAVPVDNVKQVISASTAAAVASVAGEAIDLNQDHCGVDRVVMAPARFRPQLHKGPVSQAVPFDSTQPPDSARAALTFAARDALPAISLAEEDNTEPWTVRADLLSSRDEDPHFVLEVEADGSSRVRFGNGKHGRRPSAGKTFTATYRVGNGTSGNIGADTLIHAVSDPNVGAIDSIRNPLPAMGGVDMESIDEVRRSAPYAFQPRTLPGQPDRPDGRTLGRAVTPADYAAVTETHAAVQRAAATVRWTGSWRTMSVTVDRLGGLPVSQSFEDDLRRYLEAYRLAGHDLEIEPPRPVALEIAMTVRVKAGYFASQVRRALLAVFSNRIQPDGRLGIFHPDNLTFGQTIYLSPLYAAGQAVDGVEWVDITTFQRRDRPGTTARDEGRLTLSRLEIARLDNDPNFPERGTFSLKLEGGR